MRAAVLNIMTPATGIEIESLSVDTRAPDAYSARTWWASQTPNTHGTATSHAMLITAQMVQKRWRMRHLTLNRSKNCDLSYLRSTAGSVNWSQIKALNAGWGVRGFVVRQKMGQESDLSDGPQKSPDGGAKRLIDRFREAIRSRHYSLRTEQAYWYWIRYFVIFHDRRHPAELGAAEVTAFLSWLATERNVAAATQNQALSALLFLYQKVLGVELPWLGQLTRAKRPVRVPAVLTEAEGRRVWGRCLGAKGGWGGPSFGAGGARGGAWAFPGRGRVLPPGPPRGR